MNFDLSKNSLGRILSLFSKKILNIFFLYGINHIKKIKKIRFYNIKKIKLSGDKINKKIFYKHSGYLGGLKEYNYYKFISKNKHNFLKTIKCMISKNCVYKLIKKKIYIE
ncbi:uL13 family ribosomal protein [Candidatus Vidania fulgoroideorum]